VRAETRKNALRWAGFTLGATSAWDATAVSSPARQQGARLNRQAVSSAHNEGCCISLPNPRHAGFPEKLEGADEVLPKGARVPLISVMGARMSTVPSIPNAEEAFDDACRDPQETRWQRSECFLLDLHRRGDDPAVIEDHILGVDGDVASHGARAAAHARRDLGVLQVNL